MVGLSVKEHNNGHLINKFNLCADSEAKTGDPNPHPLENQATLSPPAKRN